ncbi:hypothetical protein BUALT_Bualt12G0095400 [Buddleja alternifolia]|uniref:Uncharacterized protein n=1 Tax=Buddleja alternifolia TaxID=168488 RepID=A0AAV6WRJ2_9LAMI|nr:hypothetical protein BUALT_Bualt12G0095400 [Buddleja alternifolia]
MVACGSNASSYQGKKMVTYCRMWTKLEEDVLVQSLKEIISTGWKANNGFRVGYLNVLQDLMMRSFSRIDLRSSSTSKQLKKGERKKDDGIIGPIMEGINKFIDKTDSRLGEIVSKMGHEYELTRKCEAVFDIVNQISDLTLDEKLVATNMIVKNTQVLAMFFSLPENAKVGQVKLMLARKI